MVPLSSSWFDWALIFAAGLNSCIGNLLLKQSRLVTTDTHGLGQLLSPWFLGGLAFYGINVVLFARALDKLPVSTAYPVLAGSSFALLILASRYFFDEHLNLSQFIGLSTVLLGIVLLSRS
jgi:multidrug transporter EmrE-like cation transporter